MSDQVPTAVVHGKLPPFDPAAGSGLPADVLVVPTYPLYTPGQVGLATFLGGPPAGAWLLARNFKRLGQPGRGHLTVILGIVGTAILLGCALALNLPSVISIVLVFAMVGLARSLQGKAVERHEQCGGRRASNWRTAGVGLISCAGIFALLIGGAVALELLNATPRVVLGHGHEIFYKEGADEAEARALGEQLTRLGYFSSDNPASVQVEHAAGNHVVSFVVQDSVFADQSMQDAFHEYADKLSKSAFGGEPVDVRLTDGYLEAKVVLPWAARPQRIELGNGGELWYRRGASEAEGRAVAALLVEGGYFADEPATVVVMHEGRAVVGFYVRAEVWENATAREQRHDWATVLSQAFAGAPVDIWLLSAARTRMRTLRWEDRPRDP